MRLICPNCGAQYEVAEDVVPAAGRDVQCSNCAHTWFETPGASVAAEAGIDRPPHAPEPVPPRSAPPVEMEEVAEAEETWDEPDEIEEPTTEPEPVEEVAETEDEDGDEEPDFEETDAQTQQTYDAFANMLRDEALDGEPEDEPEHETAEPAVDAQAAAAPRRSGLSPEVSTILKEEAARERAARGSSQETFESQQDLGLEPPARPVLDPEAQRAEETRRRMARLRGEAAPPTSAAMSAEPATRKDLLPDIEEINSSLHRDPDHATAAAAEPLDPEEQERVRRKGFRYGFGMVGIAAAILAGVYLQAPRIAATYPAAGPALIRYVDTIDAGRLWLDLQLQDAIAAMTDEVSPLEG